MYYPSITKDEVNELITLSNNLGIQKLKFANPERCMDHDKGYYGRIKNSYYETAKMISECIENNMSNLQITNISNPFCMILSLESRKIMDVLELKN